MKQNETNQNETKHRKTKLFEVLFSFIRFRFISLRTLQVPRLEARTKCLVNLIVYIQVKERATLLFWKIQKTDPLHFSFLKRTYYSRPTVESLKLVGANFR